MDEFEWATSCRQAGPEMPEHKEHKRKTKGTTKGKGAGLMVIKRGAGLSVHASFLPDDCRMTTGHSLPDITHCNPLYLCKK